MQTKRAGRQTVQLSHPPSVVSFANIGGRMEGQGPLSDYFDELSPDTFFGKKTWEQGESAMQERVLRRALDPENSRQATKIPDSIYLMSHISCRAILVECGFLSNPSEDALLQTSGYPTKIAAALAGAYLGFAPEETADISEGA